MTTKLLAILVPALLAACTTSGEGNGNDGAAIATDPTIRFETSACFGFCPAFSFTLDSDGVGRYVGKSHVAAMGERTFTATPEEYAALRDRLGEFRPDRSVSYDYENCDGPVATDHPSVEVAWMGSRADPVSLSWYMGCRQPELVAHSEKIYGAWQELPALVEFVGQPDER